MGIAQRSPAPQAVVQRLAAAELSITLWRITSIHACIASSSRTLAWRNRPRCCAVAGLEVDHFTGTLSNRNQKTMPKDEATVYTGFRQQMVELVMRGRKAQRAVQRVRLPHHQHPELGTPGGRKRCLYITASQRHSPSTPRSAELIELRRCARFRWKETSGKGYGLVCRQSDKTFTPSRTRERKPGYDHPIRMAREVLGVSTSGYYAWAIEAPSARAQANAQATSSNHPSRSPGQ